MKPCEQRDLWRPQAKAAADAGKAKQASKEKEELARQLEATTLNRPDGAQEAKDSKSCVIS